MGRTVLGLVNAAPDIELAGAVTEPGDPGLGRDAGELAGLDSLGVPLTDDREQALDRAQVAIDFTLPIATQANLRACVDSGTAIVIGTTGLEAKQFRMIEEAAHQIPLVYARNMSVAMTVFMALVQAAGKALGEEYDAEIIEAHHRQKVDAPSGTALALGERIATARGHKLKELAVFSRHGQVGPRVANSIGFSVIRGGQIVGDHTVMFIGDEERIELAHRAGDRRAFARGALRAARWVAGRAPGLYSMADVLGLASS